jgi:hypothetical protein
MKPAQRGQLIAFSSLVIVSAVLVLVPSRMVFLRYLGIFGLMLCAVNILLSRVIPSAASPLGQRLVLFTSISAACLIAGGLLVRSVLVVGLCLIGASLLLDWFVTRKLRKRVRTGQH